MRVIGIAFSDLHLGEYSKFNEDNKRTLNHIRVLYLIKDLCIKYKCPAFFCGDFMHRPEFISTSLDEIIIEQFEELNRYEEFNIYGISGNHCMPKANTIEHRSPSHWANLCRRYSFLHNIDFSYHDFGKFRVVGIPYIDHNNGLDGLIKSELKGAMLKPTILLLHTDYPGAKDTDNTEVGTVENLNVNLLSKFKLVLIGHIHKPQRLGKKVYMVGAPLQQRRTDRNCKLGYWKIYEDFSMEFKPFKCFPKFIDVSSEDEIMDDGNYYTVIASKSKVMEVEDTPQITRELSKKSMVRKYMKAKGIKDKKKKATLLKVIKEAE